jgi:RNA polymerase primary sigma factor
MGPASVLMGVAAKLRWLAMLTAASLIESAPDGVSCLMRESRRHRLLTASEEWELARRIECGDTQARERLVRCNLRLVVAIARRYPTHQLPLLDLVQEGCVGLIHAADRFDYRYGCRFSTYASWWIREAISKALAETGRPIRVPVGMTGKIATLRRAEAALQQRLGRPPSAAELADCVGLTVQRVQQLTRATAPVASLNEPLDGDGGLVLGDLIRDETAEVAFEEDLDVDARWLRRALGQLPERDRLVVKLRFGLDGASSMTLDEVARRCDVSRARVGQIEHRALQRLRRLVTHQPGHSAGRVATT